MNKLCKYHIVLTIVICILLIAVLKKLDVIENIVTGNLKNAEAIEQQMLEVA